MASFWQIHTDWDSIQTVDAIKIGDRVWPRFQDHSGAISWSAPHEAGVKNSTSWRIIDIGYNVDNTVAAFKLQDYTFAGETKGCILIVLPDDLGNLNNKVTHTFDPIARDAILSREDIQWSNEL